MEFFDDYSQIAWTIVHKGKKVVHQGIASSLKGADREAIPVILSMYINGLYGANWGDVLFYGIYDVRDLSEEDELLFLYQIEYLEGLMVEKIFDHLDLENISSE